METDFHDLLLLYCHAFGPTRRRSSAAACPGTFHPNWQGARGCEEGGGFWLLLVVANKLQKGEPTSSPAWHLHFSLSSPVVLTPTEKEIEKEGEKNEVG